MTATEERTGFLAKICGEPEEDTHRLVYADWLEENGEAERAELIRVQVEADRIGVRCGYQCECDSDVGVVCEWCHDREQLHTRAREWCHDREQLHTRARELLATQVPNPRGGHSSLELVMRGEVRLVVMSGLKDYSIRRGLIHSITCTAADWLTHADALAWHPTQTVECGSCKGQRHTRPHIGHGNRDRRCDTCDGTGRIPRPCPPTAQPIREVTLTTHPEGDVAGIERQRDWIDPPRLGGHVLDCWRAEWPWITFNLPPEPV